MNWIDDSSAWEEASARRNAQVESMRANHEMRMAQITANHNPDQTWKRPLALGVAGGLLGVLVRSLMDDR